MISIVKSRKHELLNINKRSRNFLFSNCMSVAERITLPSLLPFVSGMALILAEGAEKLMSSDDRNICLHKRQISCCGFHQLDTCITLDDTEPQTPDRARRDDHRLRSGICPSDLLPFVKLRLLCAGVRSARVCEARTKGWRACYLLCRESKETKFVCTCHRLISSQRPWNSSALKYLTFRCQILVCHVISAN